MSAPRALLQLGKAVARLTSTSVRALSARATLSILKIAYRIEDAAEKSEKIAERFEQERVELKKRETDDPLAEPTTPNPRASLL